MEALIADGQTLESFIYGLLMLLILSVFVNLYFLQNRMFTGAKNRKLKRELPKHIQAYLLDQLEKTKNVRRHQERSHIDNTVVKLRSAYLAIEAKCLDREVDSKEYWNLINSKVKKLFAIISDKKISKPLADVLKKIQVVKHEIARSDSKPEASKAAVASLDKFRMACIDAAENASKLDHYSEKMDQLLAKMSNASYRKLNESAGAHKNFYDESSMALERLQNEVAVGEQASTRVGEDGKNAIADSIQRYRDNNQELQDGIDKYGAGLDSVKQGVDRASASALISSSEAEISDASDDLDELSEQIQEANEKEIARLRDVVKDQRSVILELEMSLEDGQLQAEQVSGLTEDETTASVTGGDTKNVHSKDIGILKQSLKEAENCVLMLEGELERLKQAKREAVIAEELSSTKETAPLLSDHDIVALQSTIESLEKTAEKNKEAEKVHTTLMSFFKESFGAQTIEDVSLFLYQTLLDLKSSPNLIIYTPKRDFEINSAGKLSERNKILIKNMHIGEVNPGTKNEKIIFRFSNYGGMITPESGEWQDEDMATVIDLIQSADKIIDHIKNIQISRQQKQKIDECANEVKRMAHDIDGVLDSYSKRTHETIGDTFGQIQDIARARGMSATQVAGFKRVEKEALQMLSSDDSLRLKTKKKFLQIVQKIEKP